ncbi:hypothetical protein [Halolamina sp.]|jgi:predicted transcriptional regulator|uniref:hypothetical protein n=1 Tax=Halolamina sp. TaxID=1940283 RepID=UPI000223B486|nr:hypothetical protein Halar_1597 [halophilic archaeon DL31]
MTTDTLQITYGQRDELREAGRERLECALDGETDAVEQDDLFVLDFESYADVAKLMRTSNYWKLSSGRNRRASARQHAQSVGTTKRFTGT